MHIEPSTVIVYSFLGVRRRYRFPSRGRLAALATVADRGRGARCREDSVHVQRQLLHVARLRARQIIISPPLTSSSAPVITDARSEARNATAFAQSASSGMIPSGMSLVISAI